MAGASTIDYSYALESSPREVQVPGVVHFRLGGQDYAVNPLLDEGWLLLVFADATPDGDRYPASEPVPAHRGPARRARLPRHW